jgi:hypothetical protein
MTGFGGPDSYCHGFQIAYFAQNNDIRIMSQGMHESGIKRVCVFTYIPLQYQAQLI